MTNEQKLAEIRSKIENLSMDQKDELDELSRLAQEIADLFYDFLPLKEILVWFESLPEEGCVIAVKAIFFQKIEQFDSAKLEAIRGKRKDNSFSHWEDLIKNIMVAEFEKENKKK